MYLCSDHVYVFYFCTCLCNSCVYNIFSHVIKIKIKIIELKSIG